MQISVRPSTDRWGEDDDRWRADLLDLRRELERDVPDAVLPAPPGGKGIELVDVIVSLGSAGVFTAMVDSFRAWLGRRPANSAIEVTIDDGSGVERTVKVTGSNIDGDVLGDVASGALGA